VRRRLRRYAGFLKGIYARAFHTGTSSVLLIVSYEFLKRTLRVDVLPTHADR